MPSDERIREHLAEMLAWKSAHSELDRVVKNVPPDLRGSCPTGSPYSLWQLLEHVRRAQWDILDFCTNPEYASPKWPDAFWPPETTPPAREDWQHCIDTYRRDRQSLIDIVQDSSIDLLAPIPHGEGQTCFREILLVADHTSYHVGQIVVLRRCLGIWPP